MKQTTKFLHVDRNARPGYCGSIALCGRMVNRLSVLHPDQAERATCPKCVAKAALQLAAEVA